MSEKKLYLDNKYKAFDITSVCKADLEDHFSKEDIDLLDDAHMAKLASKMADDYLEQLFWISLKIIAEDIINQIKKERDKQ